VGKILSIKQRAGERFSETSVSACDKQGIKTQKTGILTIPAVKICNNVSYVIKDKGKDKGQPCTATEVLYRPYGP